VAGIVVPLLFNPGNMRKMIFTAAIIFLFLSAIQTELSAQCSICTKTAQQLGEGPAKALNSGILYLMVTPFAAIGYIIYRWIKHNNNQDA